MLLLCICLAVIVYLIIGVLIVLLSPVSKVFDSEDLDIVVILWPAVATTLFSEWFASKFCNLIRDIRDGKIVIEFDRKVKKASSPPTLSLDNPALVEAVKNIISLNDDAYSLVLEAETLRHAVNTEISKITSLKVGSFSVDLSEDGNTLLIKRMR